MNDLSILIQNPEFAKNIKLEISGADLLAFGESIHRKALADNIKPVKESEIYLTPDEMAKTLKVSKPTLWKYDKRGITKPLHIGGKVLYRKSDIEKSFKNQGK